MHPWISTSALLWVSLVGASACSDIRENTFEIELTTDTVQHTVELWYQPEGKRTDERAYSLRFPQKFYAYRDNHHYLKQTTVGLLLEKPSLRSFAQVISEETGVRERISEPRHREGSLKSIQMKKYPRRDLFVAITGGPKNPTTSLASVNASLSENHDFVGQQSGFYVYSDRSTIPGVPASGLVGVYGADPTLQFWCGRLPSKCDFFFFYHNTTVKFALSRAEIATAPNLANGIKKILDAHIMQVSGSAQS